MKSITFLLLVLLLTSVLSTPTVYSKPDAKILKNNNTGFVLTHPSQCVDVVVVQQVKFDPNKIATYVYNKGIFNHDWNLNAPGFEWPIENPWGPGKFACFTAGLSISAKINGQLRQTMASYRGEYAQGFIIGIGGPAYRDSTFRVYKIKRGDNQYNNPDYAQWGNMVPFGAPYIDINNNYQYDPGIDKPGIQDAKQVTFVCLTDGFPEEHTSAEGFGGGTLPIMAQVQFTAWGYDTPGLEDVQFFKWIVINKNSNVWDSTYISIVVDSDLGWSDDDYIGCDTTRDMGFCYNGDDDDNINQSSYAYGPSPPAFGMDLLSGAVNYRVSPPDTLGLTSFAYFTNTGSGGPPCENDPNGDPVGAYNMMQGLKKDRTPWYNPMTGFRTKYTYPGDPESAVGWTEWHGSVRNCNGDSLTPNNVIATNPPGDRRFIMSSGAGNFKMNPGESQKIVLAHLIERGYSNLNSVTELKDYDDFIQYIYNTIGVSQISLVIPENYKLHQNYPNPFNPTTNIRFDIHKSSQIKLVVYDILGKEVATLVNEKLSAGSYEVEWPAPTGDASSYPSGVYFYKLVADGFSDVKKMILLK